MLVKLSICIGILLFEMLMQTFTSWVSAFSGQQWSGLTNSQPLTTSQAHSTSTLSVKGLPQLRESWEGPSLISRLSEEHESLGMRLDRALTYIQQVNGWPWRPIHTVLYNILTGSWFLFMKLITTSSQWLLSSGPNISWHFLQEDTFSLTHRSSA